MRRLLPFPFIKHFPNELQDSDGAKGLADFLDEEVGAWEAETIGIETFRDPARMPAVLLDEAGYFLAAGIREDDSERTKRVKVAIATSANKNRGLWGTIKPIIDARVGSSAVIFSSLGGDDFILYGSGLEPNNYWSVLGGADESASYGIRLSGAYVEVAAVKGQVLIDVGSSTLTADQVQNIINDILDSVPAYERVILGYVGTGGFVAYPNGVIG